MKIIKNYPVSYLFDRCANQIKDYNSVKPEDDDFEGCIMYEIIGKDVNYKFEEEGDTLFIYFQGSRNKSGWDWFRNFFHFPWHKPNYPGASSYFCHSGYLMAWSEVQNIIVDKITEADEEGYYKYNHIIIVGYSYGGAMAVLCRECCWYYRNDLNDNDIVGYAFEAPRVIFGFFCLSKKKLRERWKNFFVYQNRNDIVPTVPFAFLGFRHPVPVLHIGHETHGIFKDHMSENVLTALKLHENDPFNF